MSKQEQQVKTSFKNADVTPKMAFGINVKLENCIQCISCDKFVFIVGYYAFICRKHGGENALLVPIPQEYGTLTSFACDEYGDFVMIVFCQRKEDKVYLVMKICTKVSVIENRTRVLMFDGNNRKIIASNLNCKSNILCCLAGPVNEDSKDGSNQNLAIIVSIENKYNPKTLSIIPLNSNYTFKNLLISKYDPDKVAIYGNGGLAVLNAKAGDKTIITDFGTSDKEKEKKFAKFTFNIVSCTWVPPSCVCFLDDNCDIITLDYSVGNGRCHKYPTRANMIFDGPSSNGVALFEKDGNLFVVRNDGFIVKLENRLETRASKEDSIFVKLATSTKASNMPTMELRCLSAGAKSSKLDKSPFSVMMATKDKQMYKLDLQNDNAISDGSNYKHYYCPYHSLKINSLDVAKLKSTIVTASQDKTVRIWNYLNYQLEVNHQFQDEPLKVSFHPNGLHIAVMFANHVKLYDVLEDRLNLSNELSLAPNPNDVKFSNYGGLIGVCSKISVKIYNFYTKTIIFDSSDVKTKYQNMKAHTDDVTSLCWDLDDTGIATCGNDGKVIYWNLNKLEQTIFYQNKDTTNYSLDQQEKKFKDVQILTEDDLTTKHLIALNEIGILDIYVPKLTKDSRDFGENKEEITSEYLVKGSFSSIIYDHYSKLLFFASTVDMHCGLKILDYSSYKKTGDINSVTANSEGIFSFKPSPDLRNLFTSGNDGSLFIFETKSFTRNTDSKDTETKEDMIIVLKDYLDENAKNLRKILKEKDSEIEKKTEENKKFERAKEKEKKMEKNSYNEKISNYNKRKNDLKIELEAQEKAYENKIKELQEVFDSDMKHLQEELEKNLKIKKDDKEEGENSLKAEKTKRQRDANNQRQQHLREENALKEQQKNILDNLNEDITKLQAELDELNREVEKEKQTKMENNDKEIAKQRVLLDNQKKEYENHKNDHAERTAELKKQIEEHKANNKIEESKKVRMVQDVNKLKMDNASLTKQIADLKADIEEKKRTITDKNEMKKKLEKDNQELEKFKYVLHYKIKELKHSKEPKERKIQQMEKKAKDMEREIKNCESNQAKIIIKLSTNHQIIKIHEEQISKTEKRIEELRKYKKLFQESLYNAMRRAKNHKDCKKELVLLKRNFLDKEKIDNIDKPFECNYELQREFLEKNVEHYKNKISGVVKLFGSDHEKVMKEKRQLIEIVNQLKKEEKEIKDKDFRSIESSGTSRTKTKNKESVPKFGSKKKISEGNQGNPEDEEEVLKELATELKDIEKKIQWYKYWDKRHKDEEEKKKNKENREKEEFEEEGEDVN